MTEIKEMAENAIKWIDALPSFPQPPINRRGGVLGNEDSGYSYIGAGCKVLGTDFDSNQVFHEEFTDSVGMKTFDGEFTEGVTFWGKNSMFSADKFTAVGFKRTSYFMQNNPESMFIEEVAGLIREHYDKLKPLKAIKVYLSTDPEAYAIVMEKNYISARKLAWQQGEFATLLDSKEYLDLRTELMEEFNGVCTEPRVFNSEKELSSFISTGIM